MSAGFRGDREEAERTVADVRQLNETARNPVVEPQMLSVLGDLAFREEDWSRAHELYARSLEAARSCGFLLWELWQSASLIEVELKLDRLGDAERTGRSGLLLARRMRDRELSLWVLSCLAVAALRQGALERAGVLWGAVSQEERERPPARNWEELVELRTVLTDTTDPRFLAAVEVGRLTTLEQAIAVVLGDEVAPQTVP